jgi:hypothetical protein
VRPTLFRGSVQRAPLTSPRLRYTELKNVVRERAGLTTLEEAEAFGKAFNFKVSWQADQSPERLLAPKL